MERKANKTDWQAGRNEEGLGHHDHGQFKVISLELLGVLVSQDCLTTLKHAALCVFPFRCFLGQMEVDPSTTNSTFSYV